MKKKAFLTTLQVLATAGILYLLFRDPVKDRQMWDALTHANLWWILTGLAVFGAMEFCAVARWQLLLRVQGVNISWRRLWALLMIGLFFNPFMPGGTGGDVAKIYYLIKETPDKKPAALLAVLMDRVIGMLALMVVAGMVIAFNYQWLTHPKWDSGTLPGFSSSVLLYSLLAIFVGTFVFIAGAYALTSSGLIHKLPQRAPFRDKLLDLAAAYNAYGRAWRSSLLAFLFSIPIHMGSFTAAYCGARAFSESAGKATLMNFWAIMPIINTISCLPLTIGGAGVREKLFVKLLGDLCGISAAVAIDVSLTYAMIQLLWGLAGGVVYWFYRPSDHARLREIKRDVSALSHEIADSEEAS